MRSPLISIIGSTGTGKSQLAVELALALNGEVINADAMQLYRGLPIITNKITDQERRGVPHHLLGFLDTRDVWQVGCFVREAEKTIEDIRKRGRLPILVGGTHYYVQSLLLPHSVPAEEDSPPPIDQDLARKYPILDAPTPELYSALQAVDPIIAARWHPNDRRKIRRSLEIYYSMGGTQTASALYASQRAAKAQPGGEQGAKDQNLIFWVHAETDVLRARLDARVDTMITNGMWEEIEEMETLYLASSKGQLDLNAGIWQSIGFKEFLPYLELRRMGEATETQLEVARNVAIENMKTATRQYAKTQVRWLRIKLLNALRSSKQVDGNGKIFLLDSTDLPHYSERVVVPALDIAKDFLLHKPLPDPLSLSPLAEACLTPKRDYDISQRPDLWKQRTCTICEVTTTNDPEWGYHIKSNKHKKKLAGVAKRKEIDEFLKNRERKKLAVEQEGREADEVLPEL